MRQAHFLRSNKGNQAPTLIVAFDTETDSVPVGIDVVEARLAFGWLAVSRRHRGSSWSSPKWHRFDTPDAFWEMVNRETRLGWRIVLAAHNVGFDFRVVQGFSSLVRDGWECVGAVIDDPPTILRYRKGRRSMLILDTLNYYRVSLAELGASIGLPKIEHDLVWGDREKDDAYCKRDAEIVLRAMTGLIDRVRDLDLGNFAYTFPSLAFGTFRHRHLKHPVLIDDNPKALEIARSGYYGGRTEPFRIGPVHATVSVYDVNSLYPSVMQTTKVPTILRGVWTRLSTDRLREILVDGTAIADVTVQTEQSDYPLARDGRLLFPVGEFRTTLPGPELGHALSLDHIIKIHRVAVYESAEIFRTYVDEWYGRRLEARAAGDVALESFCKYMLNALYGKFGQRGETWDSVGETDLSDVRRWIEVDAQTREVRHYRSLGGIIQLQSGEKEARDSHPAIAATITSAARMVLLDYMNMAGRPFVVYVDTDSVFVLNGPAQRQLAPRVGSQLGQLKLERTLRNLTIYSPKDYAADGYEKHKGIRKNAVLLAPGKYAQDMFEGLAGAVQRGDVNRQLIYRTEKTLHRQYQKGTVDASGFVHPFRLG